MSPRQDHPPVTAEHLHLRLRLLPLLQVEQNLLRLLTPPGTSREIEATHPMPGPSNGNGVDPGPSVSTASIINTRRKKVSVNTSSAWKEAFSKMFWKRSSSDSESAGAIDWDDPHDPTRVLNALREDMMRLWHDPAIRLLLKARKLRLEEMPGL